ncbi:MFS transporter [Mycetocola tolaasinivorans]|uniref:MFS transporter n=1 Tax=Mycetocola tolaasinivorans TaxID=76635 RepID=UPI0016012751|nr:MFS transporter [Mycetocola tolaasinivorans]
MSATVGRSAYALVFLPLLFAVQSTTGSVAVAGLAVAVCGATAACLAPFRARLIDRFDRRWVLLCLALAYGGTLILLALGAFGTWPGTVMTVLAGLAGAVAPPIGPAMRVAWSEMAADPDLRRRALSLDAVVEEMLYLVGPAVSGLLLAVWVPGAVMLVPAGLVMVGAALFAFSPGYRPRAAAAVETPDATETPDAEALAAPVPSQQRAPSPFRDPRFLGLLLPVAVAGLISGNLTIALPAAFPGAEGAATAGIALGLFAGASALGGLIFGALRLTASSRAQLLGCSGALVLLSSLAMVSGHPAWLITTVIAAGLFFSPVMIVAYLASQDFGGELRRTESTTWVNTAHNVGGTAGTALAGFVIQGVGPGSSFLAIGAVSLVLLLVAAPLSRTSHPRWASARI